jgi:isopentenyl diphosphate isomerase/L-lactate dehydrogenase-like FMN-dependent dehydrogenase
MGAFQYKLSSKSAPITIEDYRQLARRAVPDMVWAYVDYGAEEMTTLNANRLAFDRYRLRMRVLTGNEATDLNVNIAGADITLPVLLAPTGLAGLSHWTGEVGTARAAEKAGTLSILSTASSYSIEEVAEASTQGHFFQLYPWADLATGKHDLAASLMDRAQTAGYRALVITVDVPAHGNRESERRRGMGVPPVITPARVLDAAMRPKWWAAFLKHRRISARNMTTSVGPRAAVTSLATQYRLMRPELNWDDFSWMRDHWDGPLYVKGILDADDAAQAVERGATGVIVSNHGGRQLDGAVASLDALPAVVARVGDQVDVLVDGGIRRGSDVVKALCLGARAVLIGRPYLYGLAARGPAGVEGVLSILRQEIKRTMTIMGVASIKDLDASYLLPADTTIH